MAKQLNIDMNIRANTDSAQAELKKLKQTLDDAINSTIKKSGNTKLTSEITEATQAAAKLKLALENATNVKTGNLDLSKFSEELSKSKMNLKQYSTQLLNLGSTGEKAFLQMASAIASAEIPLRRSNGLLTGLWTTMKNTARWQLSSTALHGFLGALQGAYGYAQNLNKSLNNIQIVTGQSSDQMAKFAEEANKSAKALSTTTTAYTDAALIYYQQGLSGNEVKERTDATIKLANVSRQSAEEVSSQMTSIWNNFSKGGENLEYYADVITKLGATTASSSSEIADGLSKFAAVADTVGLSYEKASAALATVVAETRQSADTVGTAFKTLFARVEGLQLGKTLEDGVDLNKYSKALDTVGVKILDNNKQIKQMDTILDELGAKWNTIGESEQIALAQTVAGVRQYTQFMSLMNNYDKVQENQTVAEDSKGTLQKQADTYAESWEAANKRVKAAAQGIYDELLNDKFFVGLNNSLAGILEGINKFIKSLGGIPGVLGLLGTVATTVFKDQIALSIDNAIHNLAVFSGVAQDKAKQMQNDMIQVIEAMNSSGTAGGAQQAENTRMIETLKLTQQLSEKKDKLLEQDYEQLKLLTDITAQYGEQAVVTAKEADKAEVNEGQSRKKFVMNYRNDQIANNDFMETEKTDEVVDEEANEAANETADNIKRIVTQVEAGKAAVEALQQSFMGIDEGFNSENFEKIAMNLQMIKDEGGEIPSVFNGSKTALLNYGKAVQEVKEKEENLSKAQKRVNDLKKQGKTKTNEYKEALNKQKEAEKALEESEKKVNEAEKKAHTQLKTHVSSRKKMSNAVKEASKAHDELNTEIVKEAKNNPDMKKHIKQMQEYGGAIADNIDKQNKSFEAQQNYKKNVEETKEAIKQASSAMTTSFGQSLTTAFRGVSELSMGLNSLRGMFETLNNENMSFGEKFLSVATSLSMAIPSILSGIGNLKASYKDLASGIASGTKALWLHVLGVKADDAAVKEKSVADLAGMAATKLKDAADKAHTNTIWMKVAAYIAEKIAAGEVYVVILLLVAAIAILVAAAAGLVAIFNAIKANSPEEKLKAEKAAAENLAKTYEELKNKYEELKQTISDYNTALESIETLTKGTQEWRDAVRETNNNALELIKTYSLLKDNDYSIDSDGIIHINQSAQNKIIDEESNKVNIAQSAALAQQQRADNLEAANKLNDYDAYYRDYYKQAIEMMTKGDLKDQYEKGQLTADDVGKALGLDKDSLDGLGYRKAMEDALKDAKNFEATVNKAESTANSIAASYAAQDRNVQASNNKNNLTSAASRIYSELESNAYDEVTNILKKGTKKEKEEAAKKYLEQAGITKKQGYKYDTVTGDGKIKYKYWDEEENKEKTAEVDIKESASTLAQINVQTDLSDALAELDKTINSLKESGEKSDEALIGFLSQGDLTESTQEEFKDIEKDVTKAGSAKTYLNKKLGGEDGLLSDEEAKKLGYDTAEAMIAAFKEKTDDIKSEWDKITINESQYGLENAEDLSLKVAKSIQNNFDKIKLGAKGKEGAQDYINGLNSMLENVDPDKKTKALEELSSVDWTQWDALTEASAKMAKFGVTIDTGSEKWKDYAESMRQATGAMPDFDKMRTDIKSIINLTSNLEFGKTISQDEYETLTTNNPILEQYFQAQADGSQKFIGDANKIKEASLASLQEMKDQMTELSNLQKDFNKISFTEKDKEGKEKNIDWSKLEGLNNTSAAQKLVDSDDEATKDLLAQYGYDDERLQQVINNAKKGLGEAQKQLDALYENIGEFKDKNIQKDQEATDEIYASTAESFEQLAKFEGDISQNALNKQAEVIKQNMLDTATSIEDLKAAVTQSESFGITVDFEEYGNALIHLAENYDNCTNEVLEYQKALASGSEELAISTQAALENAIAIGEMSEALNLEAESVEEQANELISVNKLSEENYKVATKVAVLNQSMNKGVQDLVDNWSDYKKTLKDSEKGTEDYANAALKTKKALAQLLGVTDEDFIPDGFLELPGVMELIDKAAQGDEDAINSLGATMAKATIEAMQFNEEMKQLGENDVAEDLNEETFYKYQTEVLDGINTLIEGIENGTIQAGENISTLMGDTTESWITSLNQMAYATGMSVEEMNSLLNELGVQADVTVKDKEVETSVPEYTTYEMTGKKAAAGDKNTDLTDEGYTVAKKSVTVQTGTKKVKGSISVAQINMGDKAGTPPTITYAGRDNVSSSALTPSSSSSDSSSSSSSTPTTKAASHDHEINRYTAEENAIDGLTRQYEKLNDIKDKSFGKGKIQAIENEIKALKELKQASTNYMDAIVGDGNGEKVAKAIYYGENVGDMIKNGTIGGNVGADYRALSYGADASGKQIEYTAKDEAGNEWLASRDYNIDDFNAMFGTNIHFDLDAFGNIQNADSIRNQLQELKNNESDAYSSIADPTADSTNRYNERIAYIEGVLSRMDTMGDSIDTLNEQSEEYLDYISQLQEKNAELITEKMELGIELGDKSLKRIDRALKILGNDIYRNADSMSKAVELNDEKIQSTQNKAKAYQDMMDEAERRFALYQEDPLNEDAITPEQYAEMLSTAEEGFESLADEMQEYMDFFYNSYSGILDYWDEKISRVTSQMEDSIKVLDYYQKVIELTGRSGNYKLIGKILEEQEETAKTMFETSQARAQAAEKEWEKQKKAFEEAKLDSSLSKDALDTLENMTQLAYDNYIEAVEKAREDSLNYLEATQATFENKIQQMKVESEKFLTNGSTFDDLNKSMERQKSLSEDYLTKTNQLYETNKMLRQLNQDIDKTDSVIAKNKLKAFADEISAMQDQEKLSNTSLEIAKAKYEILQAQIALEDAQNAKSTVQLRRDSEGNYGYVYTADEEAINNAQQNLEDKVNALYNLGKKASEDFAEQMIQLEQEEWAEIEEIANNTILTTDEKNIKIAELQEYYNAKRQALSEQYEEANLALQQAAVAQRLLITDKFNAENLDIEKISAEARAEAWTESFTTTIKDQNTYEAHFKALAAQLKNEMQILDDKREQHEQNTKTGNRQIEESIEDITEAVDDLSYEILRNGGLLDAQNQALAGSNSLRDSFKQQYEMAKNLSTEYLNAANRASDLYTRTVDLVHAQVALNHANNGATYVEWGPGGVTASYDGNDVSGGGSGTGGNGTKNIKNTCPPHDFYLIDTSYIDSSSRAREHGGWNSYFRKTYTYRCEKCNKTITIKGPTGMDRSDIQNRHYLDQYGTLSPEDKSWGFSFKTGGYTGTWPVSGKTGLYTGSWNGPDIEENGKLAFLHQKELVLNADDTENVLSAVKLIRQISESIDLQAAAQSSYSVGTIQFPNSNQVLQQEVTIHAEFPNATDHNEIEEAFNSLVNRATQYANRN